MPILFNCPHCQKPYRIKSELAGRKLKCRECQQAIHIPKPIKNQELEELNSSPEPPRRLPPRRSPAPVLISKSSSNDRVRGSSIPKGKNHLALIVSLIVGTLVMSPFICCGLFSSLSAPSRTPITARTTPKSPSKTTRKTSSRVSIEKDIPYLKRRAELETSLKYEQPSPQEYEAFTTPVGVEKVHYESNGLQLQAWVDRRGVKTEKSPTIVYFHGGFAIGETSITEACAPFRNAGYVVMCPTVRGENGNAGNFELFLGEVDDAAAACRWIAKQNYVDSDRIYTFGHSVGGGISALLSLQEDVPVVCTGSSGGLYPVSTFYEWINIVPFRMKNYDELELRSLIGNVKWMQTPHIAYIGTTDFGFHSTIRKANNEKKGEFSLIVEKVRGDHFTSFTPSAQKYIHYIESLPKSE
ncbi:CocE/NonD family hydrolase [Polystyrenella longa]|nr:CocE/NonD family hydrolase [Polystyrenella longa]